MNPILHAPRRAVAIALAALTTGAIAVSGLVGRAGAQHHDAADVPLLITAAHLFDGTRTRTDQAVLVHRGNIVQVGPRAQVAAPPDARVIDVPGGTLLPGFIDAHTHHLVNGVPTQRAVTHGVTTARDLGGPVAALTAPLGGLREVRSGPILTARGGYPFPVFAKDSGLTVRSAVQSRAAVRKQVQRGASVIAVSLEPGGSVGAPWSHHTPSTKPPWPVLSDAELRAIVSEARRWNRKVVAYLSNSDGVRRALDAGIQEWAHMPCDRVAPELLRRAGRANVAISGTLDTMSHCRGLMANARDLVRAGAILLYGTDMGHLDVPHGIDAEELHQMIGAGMTVERALAAATSAPGRALGLAPLGRIVSGAPADLIGVAADARMNLKDLEYPSLVVAGGVVVVHEAAQGGHGGHG